MGILESIIETNRSIERSMKSEREITKHSAKCTVQKLLKNKYQRKKLVKDFIMSICLQKLEKKLKKTVGDQYTSDEKNKKLIITGIPHYENEKKKAFNFLFKKKNENNDQSLELNLLLDDVFKEKYLCENDVLLISCFFYHLVFLNMIKKNCRINQVDKVLLFKVCLLISQKYQLDIHFDSKSMSKILNVNRKRLLNLEKFLLHDILEFELKMLNTQKFRDIFSWFCNFKDFCKKDNILLIERQLLSKVITKNPKNI